VRKGLQSSGVTISIVTLLEFLRGIENDDKRRKASSLIEQTFEIIDVTKEVGFSYIKLFFELRKKGETYSDADTLIAATALSRNEPLVTMDRDFLKFEPLIKVKLLSS